MVMRLLTSGLVLIVLSGIALAQPDPTRPPDPVKAPAQQQLAKALQLLLREQRTIVKAMPDGVLVLRNGVLAKLDPKTLHPIGMLELFGPVADAPVNDKPTLEERMRRQLEQARRVLPAAIQLRDTEALIVIGEQFFRVDLAKMEMRVNASLVPAAMPLNFERVATLLLQPVLDAEDDTLYVVRGNRVAALRVTDGKVLADGPLPAQMMMKFNVAPPAENDVAGAAVETTIVGILATHADAAKGYWTIRDEQGNDYLLSGDMVAELTAKAKAGVRARLHGWLSQLNPTVGKGTLTVQTYQFLAE